MVGWVKYGLDCWMIEEEGKCRAEAEARGLPEEEKSKRERRKRNVRRRQTRDQKVGKIQ